MANRVVISQQEVKYIGNKCPPLSRTPAHLLQALADWAPPAPGLPPRREVVEGGRWSGLSVTAKAVWHMMWRGGGVQVRRGAVEGAVHLRTGAQQVLTLSLKTGRCLSLHAIEAGAPHSSLLRCALLQARCLRVSGLRLAELKAQASQELAAEAKVGAEAAAGAGTGAGTGSSQDAAKPVEWISTNDALVGRLMQVRVRGFEHVRARSLV